MAISGETIWITGASSGIGKELAIALAQAGNHVLVSARNQESLESLALVQPGITTLPCDITNRKEMQNISTQLNELTPTIDRLIINAGTCEYLDIDNPDWSMINRVMDVNFFGAVNTLETALPFLKTSASPHIVGIASLASAAPFPQAEAYGPSKAALQYFLDALRIDLLKYNIDVTTINPGFVKTPLTDKNDFDMPFLMSSQAACVRILHAMHKRPYRYDFPKRLSWLLKLSKFMPKFWAKKMSPQDNLSSTSEGSR